RHALPQVATRAADRGEQRGAPDDRRREQDADERAHTGTAPRELAGDRLVFVDVHLAFFVLANDPGVVVPDDTYGVKVFDRRVVGTRVVLARVRADAYEYAVCLRHHDLRSNVSVRALAA